MIRYVKSKEYSEDESCFEFDKYYTMDELKNASMQYINDEMNDINCYDNIFDTYKLYQNALKLFGNDDDKMLEFIKAYFSIEFDKVDVDEKGLAS